ncbi:hypothetical protein [Nocardia cyriacigeorgica]|uniref:hypothetical protein n=1 Tax=Nocardia cyriacigeorgica TaxID=135487 RepID=UPI001893A3FC|nr:hypothetical protein [Nocardia cyriacigeorgica]MBF6326819.1 hypothetical protein [Nocardia cyriacigeorgica]
MNYVRSDGPRDFGVGDCGHLRDLLVVVGAHARNRLGRFFSREVTQRERCIAFSPRGVGIALGTVPRPLGLRDELPRALELGGEVAGGWLGALFRVSASGTQARHWIVPRFSAIQGGTAGSGSLRYRRTT